MASWLVLACLLSPVVGAQWSLEGEELPPPDNTIKSLFLLHVHGIRTPLYGPFKGDLQAVKYPVGEHELTEEGELQMKHVGKALRNRYFEYIVHKTNPFTRISFSSEMALTNDSARIMHPILFEGRIPNYFSERTTDFDKSHLVYEGPVETECPKYTCLRDKVRIQPEAPTAQEKQLYSLLSKHAGTKVNSLETFYPIYDRLLMEKLNNDQVPNWMDKLDAMTVLLLRQKWKKKLIGENPKTLLYFTDPMISQMAMWLRLDAETIYARLSKERSGLKRIFTHMAEDVLVYAMGWILFEEAFEKEFQQPFVVDVGDTLIFEIHMIEAKETFKVFYYRPTAKDPSMRFKELSLKPFLQRKGLDDVDHVSTDLLKYFLLEYPYKEACSMRRPWYSEVPWLQKYEDCESEAVKRTGDTM